MRIKSGSQTVFRVWGPRGVGGDNLESDATPGRKFLHSCDTTRSPLPPPRILQVVESRMPGTKFRYLNLKPGDSDSADY